jgi:hypothetical protein
MICYVLACNEGTVYPHLAYASLSMVRALHPQLRIGILTDQQTQQHAGPSIHKVFDAADILLSLDLPSGNALFRSRYLKTSMRQTVPGRFAFLDVDAFPICPFWNELSSEDNLAAAFDRGRDLKPQNPDWAARLCARLGMTRPAEYYNSGVMFFPDHPAIHHLATEWHRRWKLTCSIGCELDQPALNSTIKALRLRMRVLPFRYNAMVSASPLFAWRAVILHFWVSMGTPTDTRVHDLIQRIARNETIDWHAEMESFRTKGPWIELGSDIRKHLVTGKFAAASRLVARRIGTTLVRKASQQM